MEKKIWVPTQARINGLLRGLPGKKFLMASKWDSHTRGHSLAPFAWPSRYVHVHWKYFLGTSYSGDKMPDIVKTMCYLGKRDTECMAWIHFENVKDKGSVKTQKQSSQIQLGVPTPNIEDGSDYEDHLHIAEDQGHWPNWNNIEEWKGESSFSRLLGCLLSTHPGPNPCWIQVWREVFPRLCFWESLVWVQILGGVWLLSIF